jgi:S1-C subfamily serine protease
MNWVDIVLLVLVAIAGIHGLRLGAAMQVLSFGGFWLGLLLGALVTPSLVGLVHTTASKTIIAAVVIFGMAGILGGVGRFLGAHSNIVLQRIHLGPVDSAAGVVVAVFATLVATWLVAGILTSSRFTSLNSAVANSRIVRAMDTLLPSPPTIFSRIESFVESEGFPVVFAGLPPRLAPPVTPPSGSAIATAVGADAPSTVKIEGTGCGVIREGSGFVVAPGLVVTNAHVVAGILSPFAIDEFGRHPATAALYDPRLDIAVLRVPGLRDPPSTPLQGSALVARGSTAAVLGYPEGGPFAAVPAGVADAFDATGLDIYGNATVTREIYELDAVVQPGNSGGPLVASGDAADGIRDGTVIGVVFARSTTNADVGYALALPAVNHDIAEAESSDSTVSTGACAAG